MKRLFTALITLIACQPQESGTKLSVTNEHDVSVMLYVSFGYDSSVSADDWDFCIGSGLNCSFEMSKNSTENLPLDGKYINATFSVNSPVGCGVTKSEVNLNNPSWYDTMDVSLVDGFSDKMQIIYTPPKGEEVKLGLPKGETGNERVLGLFPYGCDVCVARQNPPCDIPKGRQRMQGGDAIRPTPTLPIPRQRNGRWRLC